MGLTGVIIERAESGMSKRFVNLFQRQPKSDSLLTEFGESLLLIVDPEQLTNNLLSKLRELIIVEKTFVYLANESD